MQRLILLIPTALFVITCSGNSIAQAAPTATPEWLFGARPCRALAVPGLPVSR